jgi:glycosyltransferase involved in cell wall biosynthesis
MTDKKKPLVSIVTPVYNGEDFLEDCIESVIGQTWSDWEYVIANNCSTDSTLSIASRYAARDPRIRIIDNAVFLSQVKNMNNALRHINQESRFCKLLLADDFLFSECIEKMVQVALSDPGIGLVSSYRLIDNSVFSDGLPYGKTVFTGYEIGRMYLLHRNNYFGSETSVMLRSSDIRKSDPFFDESEYHSDTSTYLRLMTEAKFGFVHQVLTFTRRSNQGFSATSFSHYYDTYSLSYLYFHLTYGRFFMNPAEFRELFEELLYKHYRKIIKLLFRLRSLNVITFHFIRMHSIGIHNRPLLMFKAIITEIVYLPGNLRTMTVSLAAKLGFKK